MLLTMISSTKGLLLPPLRISLSRRLSRSLSRSLLSTSNYASSTGTGTRPSSSGLSLDSLLISSSPAVVEAHLHSRRSSLELIASVTTVSRLRADRNSLIVEGDAYKAVRNQLSKQIGRLMAEMNGGAGGSEIEAEMANLKAKVEDASLAAARTDKMLSSVDAEIREHVLLFPNLLDDLVPDGASEADNIEISQWAQGSRLVGEGYEWHDSIAARFDGIDASAAARISGTRFLILKGAVARLERALGAYFLDFLTARGYTEVSVPYIVSRSTLEGTGQLPKFEDDLFKVSHSVGGEDAFLIPTAEVPLSSLMRGELINAKQLPIKLTALTPCFRAEAGSYGRDTRGLFRLHQFNKVEMVRVCEPSQSSAMLEEMCADSMALLQSLELPYRQVLLCSGDIGFSAKMCYDLEVWMPGQQQYREIASLSNCGDFQARRMNFRYRVNNSATDNIVDSNGDGDGKHVTKKSKNKGKNDFPHMLNGSGLAIGRALAALLENGQRSDGSVVIPVVLRPYMGGVEVLVPHKP